MFPSTLIARAWPRCPFLFVRSSLRSTLLPARQSNARALGFTTVVVTLSGSLLSGCKSMPMPGTLGAGLVPARADSSTACIHRATTRVERATKRVAPVTPTASSVQGVEAPPNRGESPPRSGEFSQAEWAIYRVCCIVSDDRRPTPSETALWYVPMMQSRLRPTGSRARGRATAEQPSLAVVHAAALYRPTPPVECDEDGYPFSDAKPMSEGDYHGDVLELRQGCLAGAF